MTAMVLPAPCRRVTIGNPRVSGAAGAPDTATV